MLDFTVSFKCDITNDKDVLDSLLYKLHTLPLDKMTFYKIKYFNPNTNNYNEFDLDNDYIIDRITLNAKLNNLPAYNLLLICKYVLFYEYLKEHYQYDENVKKEKKEKYLQIIMGFANNIYISDELENNLQTLKYQLENNDLWNTFLKFNKDIWENPTNLYNQHYYMVLIAKNCIGKTDILYSPITVKFIYNNEPINELDINKRLWFKLYNIMKKEWYLELYRSFNILNSNRTNYIDLPSEQEFEIYYNLYKELVNNSNEFKLFSNILDELYDTVDNKFTEDQNYIEEISNDLAWLRDELDTKETEIEELNNSVLKLQRELEKKDNKDN